MGALLPAAYLPTPREEADKPIVFNSNERERNRKGHYTRALEEAVHAHANQWPSAWQGKNPLHGGGSFNNMTPEQRVCSWLLAIIRKLIMAISLLS